MSPVDSERSKSRLLCSVSARGDFAAHAACCDYSDLSGRCVPTYPLGLLSPLQGANQDLPADFSQSHRLKGEDDGFVVEEGEA
jgi:hypothetical protein